MEAEATFTAMGSEAHVIVVGGGAGLLDLARRRIEELEARWSRFIPNSEVSQLNARRGHPVSVSSETFELVDRAVAGWRMTGGKFDPTVLGDMIRAGYDRPFQAFVRDPRGGVSLLRRNCGGIILDRTGSAVALPLDAGFDPGGIGKGLAADMVAQELMDCGARGACVNLGGDLRVEGEGPDAGRWIVAVEHPRGGDPVVVAALAAGAIATSTTLKRAWTVDGEDRHHLIDPDTGRSLRSRVVAVTALARNAAHAEIATKAALLSPPGWELAGLEELSCDGLTIDEHGDTHCSAGLSRFVIDWSEPVETEARR